MADKTQIASGVWSNPAIWSPAGVPAAGQSVESPGVFDLTVDDNTNALLFFEKAGSGTLIVDATKILETTGFVSLVDGDTGGTGTIECGGNLEITDDHTFTGNVSIEMTGTGTFTDGSSSPGGANLEINTAGTVTLATDVYCVDFTMTAGTFICTGFDVVASGDPTYASGTATNVSVVLPAGSHTGDWDTITASRLLSCTLQSGCTLTVSVGTRFITRKLYTEAGSEAVVGAGDELRCYLPTANDFCDIQGDITGDGPFIIQVSADRTNSGRICASNLSVRSSSDRITQSGPIVCSTTMVVVSSTGGPCDLYVTGSITGSPAVTLGNTVANVLSGILNLNGGMHALGSLVDGNAANDANAVVFGGGCHVEFSGLGDFANIAVTASTNMPPEIVCTAGGKVTNCEPDNEIALFGDANVNDTPGTNNLNITNFVNNQSYPGSLMTMGIGGGRLLVPFLLMGMGICSMMMKGMC